MYEHSVVPEAIYCFESATKLFKEMKEPMIWERLIKWKDETIDVLNKHLVEYDELYGKI